MSRKVILYIAVSLDGYIADRDGNIDWLGGQDEGDETDYGYEEFIKGVDTILMGKNTYRQVSTELSPQVWPYPGRKTYVFTHQQEQDRPEIQFTGEEPQELVRRLKAGSGKNIWVCGGSDLANQLMAADIIDEFHLTIMPVILGGGLPLFARNHPRLKLKVEQVQEINGVIDIVYSKY